MGAAERIVWPDTVKGLSILWIVYFHGFRSFADSRYPWPLDDGFVAQVCEQTHSAGLGCIARAAFFGFSSLGFHAVGVFIVLSGFALAFAIARRGTPIDWRSWYRSRLLRLFPLYWTAHLIYLLSPSQVHIEAIDYRFVLSFLGDRVVPLTTIFYYANAAWWYFGLLLELYLVFPLLHLLRERLGARGFLVASAAITMASRYLVLIVWPSEYSGAFLLGALFTCRLFEFTVGMVLGAAYARARVTTEARLLSPMAALAGVVLYTAGLYANDGLLLYVFADALIGCGLLLIMANVAKWLERIPPIQSPIARVGFYSYGLYLLHQPYMIWLGNSLQGRGLPTFVAIAVVTTAVLAVLSMAIERSVNAAVARVLG
jgi:peptidoglycan/LPS O-acetylase OafA/YrhL